MGKATNMLNGVISGKVGAQVGFKTQDSKRPQGVRAYQPTVSNPKTFKQATQRCKIAAAQQMYSAFEPVLNHAFYPKGKASKNMRRFMSLAMKLDGIPNVPKGSGWMGYNLPYQVSEGMLGLERYTQVSRGSDDLAVLSIKGASTIKATQTVGKFSQLIISENPGLEEGMELTFLAIMVPDNGQAIGNMYAAYHSIVLDKSDQLTTLGDIFTQFHFSVTGTVVSLTGEADGTNWQFFNPVGKIAAAAVIVSSKTSTSWRYTNSFLNMTAYGLDGFDIDEQAVVESYMASEASQTSDLILQQADNIPGANAIRIVSVSNEEYTPSPAVSGATYSETDAAVATFSNGTKKVIVNDGTDELVNYAQGVFDPVTVTVGGEATNLIIDATTWDGSPTINVSDVQAAGF